MNTTIAAISTPLGAGGIGIVRISGPEAVAVGEAVFRARGGKSLSDLAGYQGVLGAVFSDGQQIDEAIAFVYRSPKSYTGEDVVELSCHGGLQAVRTVLALCLQSGAELAGPGEFTKRAYLNGKLDLSQAEAVMDIISARGDTGLRAAAAMRGGRLSNAVGELSGRLLSCCGQLAAWADYPEEEMEMVDERKLLADLGGILSSMERLLSSYGQGRALREGISTVLAGKPNVGKSTLMNLLAGQQRSIVTEVPGTTRDVVEDTVVLGDYQLLLADTAGLRETRDPVERRGVEIAREKLEQAQLVLAVFDGSQPLDKEDLQLLRLLRERPAVAVVNKSDLCQRVDLPLLRRSFDHVVFVSAGEGEGRTELEAAVRQALSLDRFDPSAVLLANERQRQCLLRARQALGEGVAALEQQVTLDAVGVCLEESLQALLELTGERTTDRVVDEVFSHFCVGK